MLLHSKRCSTMQSVLNRRCHTFSISHTYTRFQLYILSYSHTYIHSHILNYTWSHTKLFLESHILHVFNCEVHSPPLVPFLM